MLLDLPGDMGTMVLTIKGNLPDIEIWSLRFKDFYLDCCFLILPENQALFAMVCGLRPYTQNTYFIISNMIYFRNTKK